MQRWLGALVRRAEDAAEADSGGAAAGGSADADASGGVIEHGDIGPNANVSLSASGGSATEVDSGGDGEVDIPEEALAETSGERREACRRGRRNNRRRRRQ